MGINNYKGIVSYKRPDGSKTVSECEFATEYYCMNWVFEQMTNVHKYGNYSEAPDSIVGEVIGDKKRVVYTMGYNIDVKTEPKKAVKRVTKKCNAVKKPCDTKRVYLYWNEDTRSILGTYDTSIASELERNGWTKLYKKTPRIGTDYFSRCANWLVATMLNNGNYNLIKVNYKHLSNNPNDFNVYVRSIL